MELIRKLYDYKGCRIQITTDDGIYQGILKYFCTEVYKISLAEVVLLPKGIVFWGLLNFFAYEIRDYRLISRPTDKVEKPIKVKKREADLEIEGRGNRDVDILQYLDDDYYSEPEVNGDTQQESESEEEKYVLELPEDLVDFLPTDYVIINNIDDDFHDAMKHIKKQKLVGVGFEGKNIGRFGELCWLTVSTECCTFLFDVFTLGGLAFDKGLREILESSAIVKVIHDSRQPSDALFHQYKTELSNIFDTQLGDVFADMQNSKPGKVSRFVNSLDKCLIRYFSFKPEQIYTEKMRHYMIMKDICSEWKSRPLPNYLMDRAMKNVIFLRLLKERVMDDMLTSFHIATDMYLKVVRNASVKELDLEPSVPHLLPQCLLSTGLQTFHMENYCPLKSDKNENFATSPERKLTRSEVYEHYVRKCEMIEALKEEKQEQEHKKRLDDSCETSKAICSNGKKVNLTRTNEKREQEHKKRLEDSCQTSKAICSNGKKVKPTRTKVHPHVNGELESKGEQLQKIPATSNGEGNLLLSGFKGNHLVNGALEKVSLKDSKKKFVHPSECKENHYANGVSHETVDYAFHDKINVLRKDTISNLGEKQCDSFQQSKFKENLPTNSGTKKSATCLGEKEFVWPTIKNTRETVPPMFFPAGISISDTVKRRK